MKLSNKKEYDISAALASIDSSIIAKVIFDVNEIGTIVYDDIANPGNAKPTEVEIDAAGKAIHFNATKELYQVETQKTLDAKAKEIGYDSIFTAVTYADEPSVPAFQSDGQALRAWRSAVWAYAYQVLADVEAETIALPSLEDFIADAPAYVPPA